MKEFKDYWKIISRYKLSLLILMAVVGGGMSLWVLTTPKQYQASVTLYVNKAAEPSNDKYYTFEGYYSGLASIQYTDVVVGMIKTPDLTRLAISSAGLTVSDAQLLRSLQVKKLGPQLVSVSLVDKDANQAKKMLLAVTQAEAVRSKSLTQVGSQGLDVAMVNSEPMVTLVKPNLFLYVGASLAGSLILGLLLLVTRCYFLP